jgi:glycine betaine/proline transport system substrate-binding protein
MSDVRWTDITATTAMAAEVLRELGYESQIDLLSVPVTFMSLKNGDIDVFLGNWMPTQTADIKPYLDAGEVVDLGVNLEGALYTFAVPKYVSDAGVTSATHLAAHKDRFKGRIYGIEPGNDGNRTALDLIKENTYGLGGFTLVESSEQGMLGEVARAVAGKEWIVFLGWKPHPMAPHRANRQCKRSPDGQPPSIRTP